MREGPHVSAGAFGITTAPQCLVSPCEARCFAVRQKQSPSPMPKQSGKAVPLSDHR